MAISIRYLVFLGNRNENGGGPQAGHVQAQGPGRRRPGPGAVQVACWRAVAGAMCCGARGTHR